MATEQIKNIKLIGLLKENRDTLNSLFSYYKVTYPSLEKEVVYFYINFVIEPFFERNQNRGLSELSTILLILYEKFLELIGKNYLGNSGRYPFFENKFIELIERGENRIFENPEIYITSIANAIFNLSNSNLHVLENWIKLFSLLIPKSVSNKELFEAGKVAAWVSGRSEYRSMALDIIKNMRMELLECILGNSNIKYINFDNFISRLELDPWIKLENAMKENSGPKKISISKVSGYIGFGGHFYSPPKVELIEGNFIVSDNKNNFVLFADAFGYNLQKISTDAYLSLLPIAKSKNTIGIKISKDGKVQNENEVIQYLPFINYSSIAMNENTVCVTSPYFHSIFIIWLGL